MGQGDSVITRDMVQGFIDGLKATNQADDIENKLRPWLRNHHTYPCSDQQAKMILDDLGSYKK